MTRTKLHPLCATAVVAACLVAGTTAEAAPYRVSGSGSWDATAPVTAYTAPDTSWSFSFVVESPLPANPTSAFADFAYHLGGAPVAATPASVRFYAASENGLFDLVFEDASLSFYGADIADVAGGSLQLGPGSYLADVGVDGGPAFGSGTVVVSAVPEPGSAALLLAGLVALGAPAGARRVRRG